jgi:uncharacterized membrane protein YtjA (UPF0391 family)
MACEIKCADGKASARRMGGFTLFPNMLNWTLIFLVLALIAGVLGFTSIAGGAADIARILFFAFLILLVVSAAGNALRDRTP